MATVKWGAAPTSRGTVLSTQLNALANGGYSALGSAYDNSSNLDRWGWVELSLVSLNPTAGACIYVYLAPSVDGGTDYDDGPSSTNPASHLLVAALSVKTGSAAKKVVSLVPFALPPGLFKFALKNQCGVVLATSDSNLLVLYTSNEAVA
jgi:hypothetical protein